MIPLRVMRQRGFKACHAGPWDADKVGQQDSRATTTTLEGQDRSTL